MLDFLKIFTEAKGEKIDFMKGQNTAIINGKYIYLKTNLLIMDWI